jgi:hypothetical protein
VNQGPVLRDIQLPPEPGLWPPPPGIWLLGLIALVCALVLARHLFRVLARRRQRERWRAALQAIRATDLPAQERVAAASELLRRAVRVHSPAAASLEGSAWSNHLRGLPGSALDEAALATLQSGPFRPSLSVEEAAAALAITDVLLVRVLEQVQ